MSDKGLKDILNNVSEYLPDDLMFGLKKEIKEWIKDKLPDTSKFECPNCDSPFMKCSCKIKIDIINKIKQNLGIEVSSNGK